MSYSRINQIVNSMSLLWLVITMLVFSGLIKLGLWQSERAEEKELRLAHIERLLGQDHKPLHKVIANIEIEEFLNDQPVLLRGEFDPEVLIFLDNQPQAGKLGYRVFQLFYHENRMPVLVNLGWVQGSRDRSILPETKPLTGYYEFKGNIRYIETGIQLAEQIYTEKAWPLRVQQIEIEKLNRLFSQQLLPFAVYLDKNEEIGYTKHWQPVVMSPDKHRGYAFQWYSLALAWLTLMVWAAIKNNNKAK